MAAFPTPLSRCVASQLDTLSGQAHDTTALSRGAAFRENELDETVLPDLTVEDLEERARLASTKYAVRINNGTMINCP